MCFCVHTHKDNCVTTLLEYYLCIKSFLQNGHLNSIKILKTTKVFNSKIIAKMFQLLRKSCLLLILPTALKTACFWGFFVYYRSCSYMSQEFHIC